MPLAHKATKHIHKATVLACNGIEKGITTAKMVEGVILFNGALLFDF